MKKAFTLVELLAVITLLSLVALIATVSISSIMKNNKQKVYDTQINNIKNMAKNWASKQVFNMPDKENESITITLWQLKQDGFMDTDVKNPFTKKNFPSDMLITITLKNNGYVFEVLENSGTLDSNLQVDPNSPSLILIGNGIDKVSIQNSTYQDPGVIAKTSTGAIISSVTTEIYENGTTRVSQISLNRAGNYVIRYEVSNQGINFSISRTVIVR